MVITAPGLFSTTTFQPSASDKALAMMRARMSGGVLAEAGTTMRMTFDGKDCANADREATPQPMAAAPAKNSRLFMSYPFICWPAGPWRRKSVSEPAHVQGLAQNLQQEYI